MTYVLLTFAALILTVVGAFDTDEQIIFVPRFVYWWIMAVATYSAGILCGGLVHELLRPLDNEPLEVVGGSVTTGVAVVATALSIHTLALGWNGYSGTELAILAAEIFAVAVATHVVLWFAWFRSLPSGPAHQPQEDTTVEQTDEPQMPALMERLPDETLAPLVALSAEDHYVRVQTTVGEELLLMRLGDAIREAKPVPGLKVHRSHWIALDAVVSAERRSDGALLTMSHGREIPVSRRYLPNVRQAGLLEKTHVGDG